MKKKRFRTLHNNGGPSRQTAGKQASRNNSHAEFSIRFITVCLTVTVFFLSACTMPDTKIYSLNLNAPEISPTVKDGFSDKSLVILVNAPRYLSQPYIAYRNSPYELELSRYSKWEASPQEMFRGALKNYLSAAGVFKEVRVSNVVPEGFYYIETDIKKFERYDEGNDSYGELMFDCALFSSDEVRISGSTISKKIKLEDKTNLSLAKGLSKALDEAIKEATEAVMANQKTRH
jgi:ABC-type uncharacterized transport system auxiliary subunit